MKIMEIIKHYNKIVGVYIFIDQNEQNNFKGYF